MDRSKYGKLLAAVAACALTACFADSVFEVAHEATFNPEKAGWKLVFADEFDGTELDSGKWYRPHFARKQRMDIAPDGQGHLVFKVKRNEKGRFPNTYLYSIPEYKYGYFEARVKFTKGLGWWAASWMHGASKENPFLDGIEVDTFEDFFTRLVDGHPLRDRMAHSLHAKIGSHGVSQQVTTSVEPPVDGWHTIACKWRPLAFEFYLDGRLTGSYTAFNNAACIRPLHAVLSVEDMQGKNGCRTQAARAPKTASTLSTTCASGRIPRRKRSHRSSGRMSTVNASSRRPARSRTSWSWRRALLRTIRLPKPIFSTMALW